MIDPVDEVAEKPKKASLIDCADLKEDKDYGILDRVHRIETLLKEIKGMLNL